ncbi:MAG: hypothetical protein ABUS47_05855 [Steroidobacter sp.]
MTFKNPKHWVGTVSCLLVLIVAGTTQASAGPAAAGLSSDKFSTDYLGCHLVKIPGYPPFWLCGPPTTG